MQTGQPSGHWSFTRRAYCYGQRTGLWHSRRTGQLAGTQARLGNGFSTSVPGIRRIALAKTTPKTPPNTPPETAPGTWESSWYEIAYPLTG